MPFWQFYLIVVFLGGFLKDSPLFSACFALLMQLNWIVVLPPLSWTVGWLIVVWRCHRRTHHHGHLPDVMVVDGLMVSFGRRIMVSAGRLRPRCGTLYRRWAISPGIVPFDCSRRLIARLLLWLIVVCRIVSCRSRPLRRHWHMALARRHHFLFLLSLKHQIRGSFATAGPTSCVP